MPKMPRLEGWNTMVFFRLNSYRPYRGFYFKYRGFLVCRFCGFVLEGCCPGCRLSVCMGEGSQILIRFGDRAGLLSLFQKLPLNLFSYNS